jgi:hypothetical protein
MPVHWDGPQENQPAANAINTDVQQRTSSSRATFAWTMHERTLIYVSHNTGWAKRQFCVRKRRVASRSAAIARSTAAAARAAEARGTTAKPTLLGRWCARPDRI